MALTQNEKIILRKVIRNKTDAEIDEISASDSIAREEIIKYKNDRLNNIGNELAFLNAKLTELTQEKTLLENV